MSWGVELWDQYDNIAKHTERGIEFCEFYSSFIKQRSDCELAYAKNLRKLVKNFTPKKKNEDSEFSLQTGFQRLLTEVNDLAGQHESISEKLSDEVAKNVLKLAHELRHERKTHLTEGDVHSKSLQVSLESLDKSKKTYEKAFKQSCTAVENFHKADADLNLSRAEVERSKNVMHNKKTICEECKSAYAKQLESTNSLQREHYTTNIPSVFQSLQQLDERRIREVAASMRVSAEVHLKVLPIVQKCLDGMVTASAEVNPAQDSQIVIGRFKSGFNPPGDIPFEDLGNFNSSNNGLAANNNGTSAGSQNSINSPMTQDATAQQSPNKLNTLGKARRYSKTFNSSSVDKAGTISGKKKSKQSVINIFHKNKSVIKSVSSLASHLKGEESEDFKHLPPTQRQKRLQTKIDALNSQIKKEAEERDAMTRMSELYTKNPNLGDAAPLVHRLAENQKNLDGLQAELAKFQGFMHEVESQLNQLSSSNQDLSPGGGGGGGGEFRHSTSDLSMASSSTGGGGESGQAGSGGASSTHSGNTDPEAESSTPSTPQPPHHLIANSKAAFAISTYPLLPPPHHSNSASIIAPPNHSQDAFWDSPLQFVSEAQKAPQDHQPHHHLRQQLSHGNLQRHQQLSNGPEAAAVSRSSFHTTSPRANAPLPLPPRDVGTHLSVEASRGGAGGSSCSAQLSLETPIAQQLQQHLVANDIHRKSLPHRQAPQPPSESGPPAPELHVDAAATFSSADVDRVSAGSSASSGPESGENPNLPIVTVKGEEEEDPEPPSYPPPPPPPEEEDEDFNIGSAQDIDQTSSYSPESGYIGDAGCLEEDPPAIAKCKALYSFQADNAGTIHMEEGEDLEVVEEDQGDGWTRVRRPQPRTEADDGFVPTSYLELET